MMLAMILLGTGFILVYSAVKGKDPRTTIQDALNSGKKGNKNG